MTVHSPTTLSEAVRILTDAPDAHLLTGGTDLMVEINFGHRRPHEVISLRHVDELRQWTVSADVVTIGAAVPYSRMEHGELAALLPALAEASRTVGSPQIRAAGSIGGNLGTCSPAGDSLPVLFALEATVNLVSAGGRRSLPVAEFMIGPKKNVRRPDEIIESVTIPRSEGWQGFAKVGTRNAMVISVASACLVVADGGRSPRIALGSVGPTVIRCHHAEAGLASALDAGLAALEDAAVREFAERVAAESRPIDDHRSTATYRRHAVGVLARRLLERARAAADGKRDR